LAALLNGATLVCDLLDSDDVRHMQVALGLLGVKIEPLGAVASMCTAGWRLSGQERRLIPWQHRYCVPSADCRHGIDAR